MPRYSTSLVQNTYSQRRKHLPADLLGQPAVASDLQLRRDTKLINLGSAAVGETERLVLTLTRLPMPELEFD